MSYSAKTRNDLRTNFKNLLDSVGISPLENGITERIIEGVIDNLYESELKKEDLDNLSNPTRLNGNLLEAAANELGIKKIVSNISSDLSYNNFHFYLSNDITAGEVTIDNGGFIIPSGTNITDFSGNVFITIDDAVFRTETNTVYVRITSADQIDENILPNTITNHNIDLTLVANIDFDSLGVTQLLCSNQRTIAGSPLEDTDEDLRFKIQQFGNSLNQSNETRIRTVLFEIPGVNNVNLIKNKRGIGSLDVILDLNINIPSDAIYAQAEAKINNSNLIYGSDNIFIIKPEFVSVGMTIIPTYENNIEDITNLNELKRFIQIQTTDYINNQIKQGGTFIPENLINSLTTSVDGVSSFSIDCILINNKKIISTSVKLNKEQKFQVISPSDIIVT